MCLGIPARVLSLEGKMAEVEVGGIVREASVEMLQEVKEGDYILLHAGFAIQKIDQEEAQKTLELLESIAQEMY